MIRSAQLTMIVGSIGASLVVATVPAQAAAVTATVVTIAPTRSGPSLTVTAGNAKNTITVSSPAGGGVQITDALAPVSSASRSCTQIDVHSLTCPAPVYVTVLAGAGDDVIKNTTSLGATLDGAGGADFIVGGSGAELISGGAGNDVIDGGLGADQMDGGSGRDRVSYAFRTAPIRAFIDAYQTAPGLEGEQGEGDTLTTIEDATGGSGDDSMGSYIQISGVHAFVGGPGNDYFVFEGSADVDAGPGDDFIWMSGDGGAPAIIVGGPGNDRLDAESARMNVIADLGAGDDDAFGGWGDDSLSGGDGNDRLQGGWMDLDNLFQHVRLDSDVLDGGAGNDWLIGNAGPDKLLGGPDVDHLTGGPGFDLLDGGPSFDICAVEQDGGVQQNCEL